MGRGATNAGDVLVFPAGEGNCGAGQVVARAHGLPLLAVFRPRLPDTHLDVAEILKLPIAFVGRPSMFS